MKQSEELRELLHSIHRKSYPAYKGLKGIYDFRTYRLSIDHVQGDPFASPSSISVRIWRDRAGFPDTYLKEDFQRTALADFLTRQFSAAISRFKFPGKRLRKERPSLHQQLQPGNFKADIPLHHGKRIHRPL